MNKKSYVKNLCFGALLAAMCFALDYLTTTLNSVSGIAKLPLSALPIITAGITCGPFMGAAVGLIGTLLTQTVTYGIGPTTLLWIIPAGVRGLLSGLLFIGFKRSMKPTVLTVEIVISSLVVTALNTLSLYLDSRFYGYYSPAVVFGGLAVRIVSGVIASVVYALLIPAIVKAVSRIGM